jgi:hypothetical protein
MNKFGPKVLVVAAVILALRPALKLYAVQEILIILLAVAGTTTLLLLTVLAFLLFWEGVRKAFAWLTPAVSQTTRSAGNTIM